MNEKISVIDNFLDKNYFLKLQSIILGDKFPWNYSDGVVEEEDSYFQFVHEFYYNPELQSDYFFHLGGPYGLFGKHIDAYSLIKVKANLLTQTTENIEHGFHTDVEFLREDQKSKTSIFYMNTNNGYTKFEDGTKVLSVANRLVTFDSRLMHTGASCTDQKVRVVINLNYF